MLQQNEFPISALFSAFVLFWYAFSTIRNDVRKMKVNLDNSKRSIIKWYKYNDQFGLYFDVL